MDATQLIRALPEPTGENIFLLLEGGAQAVEAFRAFYSNHSSTLRSLYLHPQLSQAQEYGPWLLALKNKGELKAHLQHTPGLCAVIVSTRSVGALAVQLSSACTIISPQGKAVLARFYTHSVISLLASCNDREWHSLLFSDISQWWTPGENEWQQIPLMPSQVIHARDSAIRLNNEEWQQISDSPTVSVVLEQWQKMSSSQHFPPCVQREMVIKALRKAQEAQMKAGEAQKLYAFYYLNGGKKVLESEAFKPAIQKVIQGKVSLQYALLNHTHNED